MVKEEKDQDDGRDAVSAAAKLPQEAPELQGGHALLVEAAGLGVRALVSPLEATATERHPDKPSAPWFARGHVDKGPLQITYY
ncbi:hypothetical protein KQY30_16375 [Streptomyces sp. GMY02]|nr:hypothetical protein KQY30_16375 [Streptomyces sp. GMY02]